MAITRPVNIPVPFAVSGSKNTIPVASQIGITNGAASYTDGFPPLSMTPIAAGGVPPAGQDFNGIFNALSSHSVFLNAGGVYRFDAALATSISGYPLGVVLQDNAGLNSYVNVSAGNSTDFNATPSAIGVSWLPYAGPALLSVGGPVVGSVRNARMSIATASATATFTADEIVTETILGGTPYRIAGFNKTINLATTGVGGMDTGAPPVAGFVGLYTIYNPITGASALLATNASAIQGNVYGGANMPAGFTASALVSIWPTNSSSQLVVGMQIDRSISVAQTQVVVANAVFGWTLANLAAAIPLNAKSIRGFTIISTTNGTVSISLSPQAAGLFGYIPSSIAFSSAGGLQGSFGSIDLMTPQTIYYSTANTGTSPGMSVFTTGYTI